jgi:GT2 family glycosyltransferase
MVGIVTINYNSEQEILDFYKTLTNQKMQDWVFIIVDNASSLISIKFLESTIDDSRVKLIKNEKNHGYGKGNNIGVQYLLDHGCNIELILISNPDIYFTDKEFLNNVLRIYKKKNVDFLGPRIINRDNTEVLPQFNKRNYFHYLFHIGNSGKVDKILRLFKKNRVKELNNEKVFALSGSCFFANPSSFFAAKMFDENVFLYYEEEIFFRKVESLNMKVEYIKELEVIHDHSKIVNKNMSKIRRKKIIFKSEQYFMKKILKVNIVLYFLFLLERKLEIIIMGVCDGIKLDV